MRTLQRPARERRRKRHGERRQPDWLQKFWPWFALAALLFCWIAEATMCAERGF